MLHFFHEKSYQIGWRSRGPLPSQVAVSNHQQSWWLEEGPVEGPIGLNRVQFGPDARPRVLAHRYNALAYERLHRMLDEPPIAVAREALRETTANIQAQVYFTKYKRTAIRTHMTPVKRRLNFPPAQPLEFHLLWCTLCMHKAAPFRVSNCFSQQWLCETKRPLSIPTVIFPG